LKYRNPGATLSVSFGWLFVYLWSTSRWSLPTGVLRSSASLETCVCLPRSIFLLVRPSFQPVLLSMRLEPVVRVSSDGPRHARCVLIEIPVPTGITLRPGAAISLTVSIAGSPITLRIPAAGHIHCATCNHKRGPKGAVWRAAHAGDAAALEAALAAGGSTEETDEVWRHWNRTPRTVTAHCISLVTGRHGSHLASYARPCRGRPHPPGCGCRCECQGAGESAPRIPCSTVAAGIGHASDMNPV